MGLGRRKRRQDSLWIATEELPRTAGHVFWERVDRTLNDTEFQPFVEDAFEKFNAAAMGRPGVAPNPGVCEAFISRDGRTFSNASEYSMRRRISASCSGRISETELRGASRTGVRGSLCSSCCSVATMKARSVARAGYRRRFLGNLVVPGSMNCQAGNITSASRGQMRVHSKRTSKYSV